MSNAVSCWHTAHVDAICASPISVRMDAPAARTRYHAIGKWGRGRVRSISLTSRDLAYLFALFVHGTLSSDMLHALVSPGQRQRSTTDRLFLLKNPPNDYIAQPKAQQRARNANYASLAYEINDRGVDALVDSGLIAYDDFRLWKKIQANHKPQHFEHDFATGYILASIEIGARETGLRFISWLEVFNRQKCPAQTRSAANPLALPYEARDGRRSLIPDGLFGLEYPSGACFFALETDMGTEQQRDSDAKSSTILQKLRGYRQVISSEVCRAHLALPSLQIALVTVSVARMQNMIETLFRLSEREANWPARQFLFKAVPTLARREQDHAFRWACDRGI